MDERVRPAARRAPRRGHDKLGRLSERRNSGGGLLQAQPDMNRKAALAERAANMVAKEPLGRHFGTRIVGHGPSPMPRHGHFDPFVRDPRGSSGGVQVPALYASSACRTTHRSVVPWLAARRRAARCRSRETPRMRYVPVLALRSVFSSMVLFSSEAGASNRSPSAWPALTNINYISYIRYDVGNCGG